MMKLQRLLFWSFVVLFANGCNSSKNNGNGDVDAGGDDATMQQDAPEQMDAPPEALPDASVSDAAPDMLERVDVTIVTGTWNNENIAVLGPSTASIAGPFVPRCMADGKPMVVASQPDESSLNVARLYVHRLTDSGWRSQEVRATSGLTRLDVLPFATIDAYLDAQGDPWIAYYASSGTQIRVARKNNGSEIWNDELVADVGDEGARLRRFTWVRGAAEATLIAAVPDGDSAFDQLRIYSWSGETFTGSRRLDLSSNTLFQHLDAEQNGGLTALSTFENVNYDLLLFTLSGTTATSRFLDTDGVAGMFSRVATLSPTDVRIAYTDFDRDAVRLQRGPAAWTRQSIATHDTVAGSARLMSMSVDGMGRTHMTWLGGASNKIRYAVISSGSRVDERIDDAREGILLGQCGDKTWLFSDTGDHHLRAGSRDL